MTPPGVNVIDTENRYEIFDRQKTSGAWPPLLHLGFRFMNNFLAVCSTHCETTPCFSDRFRIDQNRYLVNVEILLTEGFESEHRQLFLRSQLVPHKEFNLPQLKGKIKAIYVLKCMSSGNVCYFCR